MPMPCEVVCVGRQGTAAAGASVRLKTSSARLHLCMLAVTYWDGVSSRVQFGCRLPTLCTCAGLTCQQLQALSWAGLACLSTLFGLHGGGVGAVCVLLAAMEVREVGCGPKRKPAQSCGILDRGWVEDVGPKHWCIPGSMWECLPHMCWPQVWVKSWRLVLSKHALLRVLQTCHIQCAFLWLGACVCLQSCVMSWHASLSAGLWWQGRMCCCQGSSG